MCALAAGTDAQLITAADFGGMSLPPRACDSLDTSLLVETPARVVLLNLVLCRVRLAPGFLLCNEAISDRPSQYTMLHQCHPGR